MTKKKSLLLIFVLMLAMFCAFMPKIIESLILQVKTTYIQKIEYTESVSATGSIEQLNKSSIRSDYPAIISQVLIKVGDNVKKGQIVATIDKELTMQKLMQASQYSQMAGGTGDASYSNIYENIPTNIYSSVDGIVESVSVTNGDYIEQSGTIATMVSGGDLFVKVLVPENKISNISLGQKADISGSGFADGKFFGYVKMISPSATRAYIGASKETVVEVLVSIENCDNSIKSGYSAKVNIQTKDAVEKKIIPYQSVTQDDNGSEFVLVVENGKTTRRDIQTGLDLKDGVEILSGIDEKDIVVLDPLKVQDEGEFVKIVN